MGNNEKKESETFSVSNVQVEEYIPGRYCRWRLPSSFTSPSEPCSLSNTKFKRGDFLLWATLQKETHCERCSSWEGLHLDEECVYIADSNSTH